MKISATSIQAIELDIIATHSNTCNTINNHAGKSYQHSRRLSSWVFARHASMCLRPQKHQKQQVSSETASVNSCVFASEYLRICICESVVGYLVITPPCFWGLPSCVSRALQGVLRCVAVCVCHQRPLRDMAQSYVYCASALHDAFNGNAHCSTHCTTLQHTLPVARIVCDMQHLYVWC